MRYRLPLWLESDPSGTSVWLPQWSYWCADVWVAPSVRVPPRASPGYHFSVNKHNRSGLWCIFMNRGSNTINGCSTVLSISVDLCRNAAWTIPLRPFYVKSRSRSVWTHNKTMDICWKRLVIILVSGLVWRNTNWFVDPGPVRHQPRHISIAQEESVNCCRTYLEDDPTVTTLQVDMEMHHVDVLQNFAGRIERDVTHSTHVRVFKQLSCEEKIWYNWWTFVLLTGHHSKTIKFDDILKYDPLHLLFFWVWHAFFHSKFSCTQADRVGFNVCIQLGWHS